MINSAMFIKYIINQLPRPFGLRGPLLCSKIEIPIVVVRVGISLKFMDEASVR